MDCANECRTLLDSSESLRFKVFTLHDRLLAFIGPKAPDTGGCIKQMLDNPVDQILENLVDSERIILAIEQLLDKEILIKIKS